MLYLRYLDSIGKDILEWSSQQKTLQKQSPRLEMLHNQDSQKPTISKYHFMDFSFRQKTRTYSSALTQAAKKFFQKFRSTIVVSHSRGRSLNIRLRIGA